ncbi:MAG: hypothetical protein QGH80_06965, partial [Acidimicrobiales bacterium]|nr:hypothetical protein [Acidimicrobiales bacterium]
TRKAQELWVGLKEQFPLLASAGQIRVAVSWIEPDAARIYICARIQSRQKHLYLAQLLGAFHRSAPKVQ